MSSRELRLRLLPPDLHRDHLTGSPAAPARWPPRRTRTPPPSGRRGCRGARSAQRSPGSPWRRTPRPPALDLARPTARRNRRAAAPPRPGPRRRPATDVRRVIGDPPLPLGRRKRALTRREYAADDPTGDTLARPRDYRGRVARVAVVGAGLGGLAAAARLAAGGHAVTVARTVGVGGRQARPVRAGRPRLRHRPEPADPAPGVPRPVRRDRWSARGRRRPRPPRPGRCLPVRRRHPAERARHRRGDSRRHWTPRLGPAAGRVDGAAGAGRRDVADQRGSVPPPARCGARRRWPGSPADPADVTADRAVAVPARPGPPLPARPPPADAARPLRDVLRLRSAARARRPGHGALRRAGVRFLVRPRRPAPAGPRRGRAGHGAGSRRPHRAARCAGCVVEAGRAAGVELADGGRSRPTSWSPARTRPRSTGDLLPRDRRTRAARRDLARATPSLSGFVLLLALRGRTPGLAHHTVLFPADYDAEFDAVFGTGRFRGAPRPVADPTVYVSAPTTRRCAPTRTASPGSSS